MNKQNNLPKYWVVKNTNNDDFKVVIDYLNTLVGRSFWVGNTYNYYGYDGNGNQKGTDGWYKICNFKNNPTLLTLEEFKKAINMEEEFVLPDRWFIECNEENKSILNKYFHSIRAYYLGYDSYSWSVSEKYCYMYPQLTPKLWGAQRKDLVDYTEITFEQFKKYVLKMENNKKIIGYKLIKPEFEKASNALLDEDCTKWNLAQINKGYYCIIKNNITINKLKKAGVLDLWFEPIYEEEVKTINMGSFNLTVKDKKVFHKNEDITDFVKGIHEFSITQVIAKWSANIKEITFSKTGCQQTETKLSDWLKVYDMIK